MQDCTTRDIRICKTLAQGFGKRAYCREVAIKEVALDGNPMRPEGNGQAGFQGSAMQAGKCGCSRKGALPQKHRGFQAQQALAIWRVVLRQHLFNAGQGSRQALLCPSFRGLLSRL